MKRAILAWMALAVAAQTERPAFEVASVKASPPTNGPMRVTTPVGPAGLTFTNVTLKNCIQRAYGVRPYQVAGGPDWIDTERFVIDAKAGGPAPHERLMQMLQTLLKERFKLVLHRENREIPAYELVVAKGGPKLTPAKEDEVTQIDGDAQHALTARATDMKFLAGALRVDRPVFDATGLAGRYNFVLDYARDDPFGVFTALLEVGLKLEPRKHVSEILVIDRAERPAAN